MVKFLYLFLVIVFVVDLEYINCSSSIANALSRYYESELQKSFQQAWQKYRKSYEHAIITTLKENVGVYAMNVYVRYDTNPRLLAAGCYFTDNVVDVLLFGMTLRDMPHLIMPEVNLAPASNMLRLEASLSKIFIDTHYYTPRNDSTIAKYNRMKSADNNSPFIHEQVQRYGSLTIIAEDCFLSGFSIITLVGSSLNVGHSPMRISDCKFTIEISSNDLSTPPVIAPYFPKEPAKQIERLLTKAFLVELVPKLQGTMYTFVNTTDIFGNDLNKFRLQQQKLFKKTADYMSDICVRLNNLALQDSNAYRQMSTMSERFEMMTDAALMSIDVTLDEMMLYGLDSAYAVRTGGSFEAANLSIADAIRFSSLQIRGKSKYVNATRSDSHDFAAELTDVTVNVILSMDKAGSNFVPKFDVVGWRKLDFSILPWETTTKIRVWYQSLITGYIMKEVPARIIDHLPSTLTSAAKEADESVQNPDKTDNDADPEKTPPSEKDIDEIQNDDSKNKDEDENDNDDNNNNGNDNHGNDNNYNDDNANNEENEKDNNDNDKNDNDNNDNNRNDNNENDKNYNDDNANNDENEKDNNDNDKKYNADNYNNDNDNDGNDKNNNNNEENMNDKNENDNNDKNNNDNDGNDNVENGDANLMQPILVFGNEDTKPAARKGISSKKNNDSLRTNVQRNNITRIGIQNKTSKGLSSKKMRSNNVRLTLTKNSRVVKQNIDSVTKANIINVPSPHMSDNDIN